MTIARAISVFKVRCPHCQFRHDSQHDSINFVEIGDILGDEDVEGTIECGLCSKEFQYVLVD